MLNPNLPKLILNPTNATTKFRLSTLNKSDNNENKIGPAPPMLIPVTALANNNVV